jgi:hypothetical protein
MSRNHVAAYSVALFEFMSKANILVKGVRLTCILVVSENHLQPPAPFRNLPLIHY